MTMVFLTASLFAVEIVMSSDDTPISKTESGDWNEDYLFFGNDLDFTGNADNLYFFGNRLTYTGETKGIVAVGKSIEIDGNTDNNIHSIGETIYIKGDINGSLIE